MDNQHEHNLVAKCRQGDHAAFGELYDLYSRKIYDFVYYKTHHRETAQDLTSEVFFKALRGIGGFEPDRGGFKAWIYRIARNTVTDHYRSRRETSDVDDVWDLASGSDAAADADTLMKIETVRAQVRKLRPEQRDIVILRVWQEMSYKEIASIVGKSEANCKMIFSRAVRQLRDNLPLQLFIAIILPSLWNK